MRCAVVMIRLAAAWRNTSVSRITGTAPEAITSASTWPGPTLGSWSASPTSSSAAQSGRAASSARISGTSTMLHSSTTSRSQPSGCVASRLNPPVFGSASSRRWIVRASSPVLSARRLAARPVGAHSATCTPLAQSTRRTELTSVVLPTPGPPVITSTLALTARRSASAWLGANASPVSASTQGSARAMSIAGQGGERLDKTPIRSAIACSER